MSDFTGPLTVTELDINWRKWRLEQPLIYEVGSLGSGRKIIVPPGFITDGASIPQYLWSMLPPWGTYSRAAVIHDYLLMQLKFGTPHLEGPDRKTCDKVFWEAMGVCGTPYLIHLILYTGVRIYGWSKGQ